MLTAILYLLIAIEIGLFIWLINEDNNRTNEVKRRIFDSHKEDINRKIFYHTKEYTETKKELDNNGEKWGAMIIE